MVAFNANVNYKNTKGCDKKKSSKEVSAGCSGSHL
jgi:hypothetical protein